jgi:hypothetical protein
MLEASCNVLRPRSYYQMMRCLCAVWLVIIPTTCFSADRPNADSGPTRVEVEIILLDLDAINTADQNFVANVYFEAKWNDPRLVRRDGDEVIDKPIEQIWHPRLQILNQQRVWSTFPNVVETAKDGTAVLRGRVWGSFSQPLNLREFPFDSQELVLAFVAAGYTPKDVALVPSQLTHVAAELSIPDWRVTGSQVVSDYDVAPTTGGKDAAIAMLLKVQRLTWHYWVTIIIPLIIIVVMSFCVFWLDTGNTSTRISIAVIAILTIVAYRFTVDVSLPTIAYMTNLDIIILAATIIVFLSLVVAVTTDALGRRERHEVAKRLDRVCRWGLPAVFLVFLGISVAWT